jgi:hypothetical protein
MALAAGTGLTQGQRPSLPAPCHVPLLHSEPRLGTHICFESDATFKHLFSNRLRMGTDHKNDCKEKLSRACRRPAIVCNPPLAELMEEVK